MRQPAFCARRVQQRLNAVHRILEAYMCTVWAALARALDVGIFFSMPIVVFRAPGLCFTHCLGHLRLGGLSY
jgi:hypothetical protein